MFVGTEVTCSGVVRLLRVNYFVGIRGNVICAADTTYVLGLDTRHPLRVIHLIYGGAFNVEASNFQGVLPPVPLRC